MVQGVVVQMTTAAPSSAGTAAFVTGNRTYAVVEVTSWYSTSASASAVRSTTGPHHRLEPAVQLPVQQELAELAVDVGLGGEVHRGVPALPVAHHAQALELVALDAQPLLGVLAALLAEGHDRHVVLVLALLAVLLLDLPLDRQPVAVPARHVGRVEAQHLPAAADDVLQDLVERRAGMQVPVRVGRPVVEHEPVPAGRGLAQPPVEPHPVPPLGQRRLALRQGRLHREGGARQEDGVAVVVAHGLGQAGMGESRSAWTARARSESRAIWAFSSSIAELLARP
jgi:hypothetical protein